MKCRHRFKVGGQRRLNVVRPIRSRFYLWEFEEKGGVITHICVTVDVTQREYWPTVTPNPAPGVRYAIEAISPHTMFVQMELKTVRSLLALFGFRSIDISNPEIEWIPENDDERNELKIRSYKITRTEPSPEQNPPLEFDIVARAILASNKAYEIETPLSFFRRSLIDMHEQQFIEAIYDMYFVLEILFAEGKFKKGAVLARFKASPSLRKAAETTLRSPGESIVWERNVLEVFKAKFSCMSVESFLEHIVDLRGFLHHQNQRRHRTWDPEDQDRYKVDAIVLEAVVFEVLFRLAWAYLEDPEVLSLYRQQFLGGEQAAKES